MAEEKHLPKHGHCEPIEEPETDSPDDDGVDPDNPLPAKPTH
jgi:hypothetical protein